MDEPEDPQDVYEALGLPDEVRALALAMETGPEAPNKLLRHPDAREIVGILALYRLDQRSGSAKLTWAEFCEALNSDNPDLNATPTQFQAFSRNKHYLTLVMPTG
jgi:hypothetical protein